MAEIMGKWTEKIPSVLWIPMIIGGIALFIGAIWVIFYGFGFVEGFGSIIMLILGWIGFRICNNSDGLKESGLSVAIGIICFAIMGLAFDQTGNFIYNQPLEWVFCPENSELLRETIKSGTRTGGVRLNQDFSCVAQSGEILRKISMFEHLAVRFVEYVLLGYVLLYLSRIYAGIFKKKTDSEIQGG